MVKYSFSKKRVAMKETVVRGYFVTEDGRVFSKGKQISSWRGQTGYLKVKLRVDKVPKDFYIHRLVALAYIPNPKNLPQVKHKDQNKLNNTVENLEWGTNKENTQEGYDFNVYTFKQRSHKLKATHKVTGEVFIFPSVRKAAEFLSYNRKTIKAILDGWKQNNFEHSFEYHEMPND